MRACCWSTLEEEEVDGEAVVEAEGEK